MPREERQNIKIPSELIEKIRVAWRKTHNGSDYGALQNTVARGVELALAELTDDKSLVKTLANDSEITYNPELVLEKLLQAVEAIGDAVSAVKAMAEKQAPNVIRDPPSPTKQHISDLLNRVEIRSDEILESAKEITRGADSHRRSRRSVNQ